MDKTLLFSIYFMTQNDKKWILAESKQLFHSSRFDMQHIKFIYIHSNHFSFTSNFFILIEEKFYCFNEKCDQCAFKL